MLDTALFSEYSRCRLHKLHSLPLSGALEMASCARAGRIGEENVVFGGAKQLAQPRRVGAICLGCIPVNTVTLQTLPSARRQRIGVQCGFAVIFLVPINMQRSRRWDLQALTKSFLRWHIHISPVLKLLHGINLAS
jgi:hypothetical protein